MSFFCQHHNSIKKLGKVFYAIKKKPKQVSYNKKPTKIKQNKIVKFLR